MLLYFSLLTIWMTYPLVSHMATSVVGETGDNIYFIFLIRWFQKAWFELGISPFFHPWLNYPEGWNLASTDTALASTLPGLLVSMLSANPTLGYNTAMLLTFVLAGWAMYTWVKHLTGSKLAGMLAGTIYAFLPYRMAHYLVGHLNLSGVAWFPLYFMGVYDLLRSEKFAWKSALLAAVMLGLIAFTAMYYLYFTLLISALFLAGYLLLVDRAPLRRVAFWKGALLLGLVALPLVYAGVQPFISLQNQGGIASRDIEYANRFAASPTDFILPFSRHFLWAKWIGAHFDRSLWIEVNLYPGIVAILLGIIALVRRKESGHKGLVVLALIIALTGFILALGPYLHWNNNVINVQLPDFLEKTLHRPSARIPLPGYLLFKYLPFYDKMRAISRVGFFTLIFTTMTAGIGVAWLFRRMGGRKRAGLAIVLIALILFDFMPGKFQQFTRIDARPVDYWLAKQPGQGAVVQFPFSQAGDQELVYDTLIHGKPYIGGFFSANQPPQFTAIEKELLHFPSYEGMQILQELGVQYVLVDISAYPDFASVDGKIQELGMKPLVRLDGQQVYELFPRAKDLD